MEAPKTPNTSEAKLHFLDYWRIIRIRKTVCGNTIHPKITQVNLKVTKEGKEPLAAPPAEKKEEKKA